ncbi:hypothetical protein C0991_004349, partial [Blastosporella zonata]
TQSGKQFLPFQMTAIENPNFDLALAVKLASEQETTDDAILALPENDPDAVEFWQTREIGSLPGSVHGNHSDKLDLEFFHINLSEAPDRMPANSVAEAEPNPLKRKLSDDKPDTLKTRRKNQHAHRWRQKRSDQKAPEFGRHPPSLKVIDKFKKDATPIKTDITCEDFPVAGGGYTAMPSQSGDKGWFFATLEEALAAAYRLIMWDGKTSKPLICKDGCIFAVLAGQPDSVSYAEACRLAYETIMEEGKAADFSNAQLHHKRGDFPAVNIGVTMGLGATYPTNLQTGKHNDMLQRLLANPNIQRLANFADTAFNLWAPNVHKSYCDHLNKLFERLPYLWRIFPRSIYPAAAVNFGPNVFTKAHRDCMNVPAGWCAIQALGTFDPTKGGHFVLPDLHLVIEFPPGALILVPSATLTHANIPVQEGKRRVSFTQFCAGGLFCFIDNGFRTEVRL